MVGRAAATERDAVVRRPLAVDDQVPCVGHRLAAGPADLVPDRLSGAARSRSSTSRSGTTSRRARERRGQRLGRADDHVGAHRAMLGAQRVPGRSLAPASARRARRRARSTASASPRASRAGWIAAQCGVCAAPSWSATSMRSRAAVASSHRSSSSAKPTRAWRDSACSRPRWAALRGEAGRAALDEVAVDALVGADLADLVDGVVHRLLHRDRAPAVRAMADRRRLDGEERRAPAAVAARRAEARDLRLEDRDPQRRIGAMQVVRRPQAGVAGADDGDVDTAGRRATEHGARASPAPCRARGCAIRRSGRLSGPSRRKGTLTPTQTWGRSP